MDKRFIRWTVSSIAFAAATSTTGLACSSFVLDGESGLIVGRNLDHPDDKPLPGNLIVNPRGISKRAFPMRLDDPQTFEWTSRFGSVTFTFSGKGFADGGMNEAGLVIEEMSLHADQQLADDPKIIRLFRPQWIQYQLDCHRSVAEVLESLDSILPTDGWHYLVADATGKIAVIELFGGRVVTHQGKGISERILTNDPYSSCVQGVKAFRGFGGDRPVPQTGTESWQRFVRGAALITACSTKPVETRIDDAFKILSGLSAAHFTKRSIVHDIANLKVLFRTPSNAEVRWISLAAVDFTAKDSRCLSCNLNDEKLSGDLVLHLKPWTPQQDRPIYDYLRSIGKENGGESPRALFDRVEAFSEKNVSLPTDRK